MLRQALESLKCSISNYIKKGSKKCIDILKQIVNEDSFDKAKSVIDDLISKMLD
jgi:hypothetical protein